MSDQLLVRVAAVAGATGVLIGAFGAHALPDFLADSGMEPSTIARRMAQFETAARYHLIHAVAILAAGSLGQRNPRLVRAVGLMFAIGILLFSVSLYLLVITDTPKLGAITPLGGATWIVAWTMLFFGVGRTPSQS
ncbi:MAG: DUF423 domain-containing protein [Planctomycetota bacterium]